MAYTVPPMPTQPRQRPGVVTAAAVLLGVVAAVKLISTLLSLAVYPDLRSALEESFEGKANADVMADVAIATMYVTAAVSALVAVGFGVLAWLDAQGKQAARVITWVLGGLSMCCTTLSIVSSATGSLMSTGTTGADQERTQELVNDAVPSWFNAMSTASAVVALLGLLTAVILLALPAANEYFRRPSQEWQPPVPFQGS